MKVLPIYGKKTVRLSLEFGLLLSESAIKLNVMLTPEIVQRAEDIFLKELKTSSLEKIAVNFTPLLLACLEPDRVQ